MQKGAFSSLVDKTKREAFYVDLNNLIRSLDFKIIAAAIHKSKHKNQYSDPGNPYNLCLQFILERAVMFLGRSSDKLIFRIESIVGHQIADLVAYPIGVSILDDKRENKAFEIIKTKFHSKNGEYKNCGLKVFP